MSSVCKVGRFTLPRLQQRRAKGKAKYMKKMVNKKKDKLSFLSNKQSFSTNKQSFSTNKRRKIRRKKKIPTLSVVMPVYNAALYLQHSINSILKQTFKDFEFIIVDDHSTDGSFEMLEKYAKRYKRIKLIRNNSHKGISISVKKGFEEAKGKFIARMDADDVAYRRRLEKQIDHLLANPKTVAVGTQCKLINGKGKVIGEKRFPTEFEEIYKYIFHFVPVQQPTLLIAKERLPRKFEYYKDGMNTAEEVELFFKLFQYGKVENLNDTLLYYRIHDKNTSFANVRKTFLLTLLSRIKGVALYGYKPTFAGVIVTTLETLIAVFLPQKLTVYLYNNVRRDILSFSQLRTVFLSKSLQKLAPIGNR